MVVFTCGHCGESLQKPKVEKHYLTMCRNRNPNLSCMDCFKDFFGKDYEAHIKCISEEERYSGKGFVAKEKKGEKKQNAWVEMLQSVLDEQKTASNANVIRIIETISKHNNTPRKKPKFINFVKNVCGHKTNIKDIDQAWDLISVKLSALSNVNSENKNQSQNQNGETAKTNGEAFQQNGEAPKTNGHTKNGDINDDDEQNDEEKLNEKGEVDNGEVQAENGEEINGENREEATVEKKLTKKQRKEEKKRMKYEAELQSATVQPTEPEEETPKVKKDKKKNKSNSISEDNNAPAEGKNKNKKRKRQDTVGAASDTNENGKEGNDVAPVKKEIEKKKLKTDGEEEADESICLHDQNVAKSEEINAGNGKFNWHAVIMSVLEKKGNEVPFKRLQKKVLAEYAEATGYDVDDRIADKFIKKLKSAPNVRVDKNRVLLINDD